MKKAKKDNVTTFTSKRVPSVPPAPAAAPVVKSAAAPPTPKTNPRITPGAAVKEWRVARSLRHSQPGYFLQGGHFQKTSRGNSFIVGEEVHFKELKSANDALALKKPTPAPAPAPAKAPTPAPAPKKNPEKAPDPKKAAAAPSPAPAPAPAPAVQ